LRNRSLDISDETLFKLGVRLDAFGAKEKMSSLINARGQCEKLLKTKKDKLSKETVEKLREILFDLTATHL